MFNYVGCWSFARELPAVRAEYLIGPELTDSASNCTSSLRQHACPVVAHGTAARV